MKRTDCNMRVTPPPQQLTATSDHHVTVSLPMPPIKMTPPWPALPFASVRQ